MRPLLREISGGYDALFGRTVDFAPQPLGRHIEADGLGGYYCDLRHKARSARDGVPFDGFGERIDWVIPVAQAALGFWELRIEGHDTDKAFLKLADWLLDNAEPHEAGGIVWRVEIPLPKYRLGPGWASAMAQGQAASVLLRAHDLTRQERYLAGAINCLPALCVPVDRGGLQASLDGAIVLEEYPTAEPAAILNGWIFALIGVHELAVAADLPEARDLFQCSADGLTSLLPRYDIGWWSLYSLHLHHGRPDLAKPFYQRLHPVLLEGLALLHPAPALQLYAARWRDQLTRLNTVRASWNKLRFRLDRFRSEGLDH